VRCIMLNVGDIVKVSVGRVLKVGSVMVAHRGCGFERVR